MVNGVNIDTITVKDYDLNDTLVVTVKLSDKSAGILSGGTGVYDSNTGVWTASGYQSVVQTALDALKFTPNQSNLESVTLEVRVRDTEGFASEGTEYIQLNYNSDNPAINDPVTVNFTNGLDTATVVYNEGVNNVYLPALVVSDDDDGTNLVSATLTLELQSGSLPTGATLENFVGTISTYGGSALTHVSPGVWTLSGLSVSQMNTTLAHLAFSPGDYNDLPAKLTVQITDTATDDGPITTDSAVINLNVNAINDQPIFKDVPETITYLEDPNDGYVPIQQVDGALIHKIVLQDFDTNETLSITVKLSDPSTGKLRIGLEGSQFSELTLVGYTANINEQLENLQFVPVTDNDQASYITISVRDGGENGTVVMTERIDLIPTPRADELVINPGATVTGLNMAAHSIELPDITLSDVDGDEQVTVTLSADIGPYYASIQRDGVMDGLYDPATGKWEITGSLTQVNQALADVMFVPDNGFSVPTGADGGTTVNVQIRDESGDTKNGKIWIINNTSFFELL